jgi:tellurite resistance protein
MGLFDKIFDRAKSVINSYSGDSEFLQGAAAAVALVINADGKIEDAEKDAALKGLTANELLKGSFTPVAIESALGEALANSTTRAGKAVLMRRIAGLAVRKDAIRQDILLIAADTADVGDIGAEEKAVLVNIGKTLGLGDVEKLLAA